MCVCVCVVPGIHWWSTVPNSDCVVETRQSLCRSSKPTMRVQYIIKVLADAYINTMTKASAFIQGVCMNSKLVNQLPLAGSAASPLDTQLG